MKYISQLLVWSLLLAFAGNDVNAAAMVDQQQPIIDTSVGGLAIGGGSQEELAQVVTAGITGILTQARFPVACASGDLVIEVQGVSGGVPNGQVLASQTIPGSSLPPFFATPGAVSFRSLVFSAPASFSAGTQFALVLRSAGFCVVFQGPIGDSYLRGNLYFDARPNPPGWICSCDFAGARFDLPFQTVVENTLLVRIDIKPGSFPNSINPRNEGVIPVAILSNDSFDASTVDPTTVRFGANGTEAAPLSSALEDVDGDGRTDMILHFSTRQTGIDCGVTSATLTGESFTGQMIRGFDSVRTVGCR